MRLLLAMLATTILLVGVGTAFADSATWSELQDALRHLKSPEIHHDNLNATHSAYFNNLTENGKKDAYLKLVIRNYDQSVFTSFLDFKVEYFEHRLAAMLGETRVVGPLDDFSTLDRVEQKLANSKSVDDDKVDNLDKKIKKLEKHKKKLKANLISVTAESDQKQETIDELNKKVKKLDKHKKRLKAKLAEYDDLKVEYNKVTTKLTTKNAQISALKADLSQMTSDVSSLNQTNQQLQQSKDTLSATLAENRAALTTNAAELERIKADLQTKSTQITTLETNLQEMTKKYNANIQKANANDALAKENTELKKKIKELTKVLVTKNTISVTEAIDLSTITRGSDQIVPKEISVTVNGDAKRYLGIVSIILPSGTAFNGVGTFDMSSCSLENSEISCNIPITSGHNVGKYTLKINVDYKHPDGSTERQVPFSLPFEITTADDGSKVAKYYHSTI